MSRLAAVGVERYHADYSRQEAAYYLHNGESYVVEPTGNFENDPNVTDNRFKGKPTRSFAQPQSVGPAFGAAPDG